MSTKKGAAPSKKPGPRVIVTEAFGSYLYGAEVELPAGAKLDKLIAEKKVRLDDRMAPPKAAKAEAEVGDEG